MLFRQKIITYLKRKHRGGLANQQGIKFEHYFATYKIAQLLLDFIDRGKESFISSQAFGFVDDLYIHTMNEHQFYQLKTSAVLSWSGGLPSLAFDFRAQSIFFSKKYSNLKLFLVVCHKNLAAKLELAIPGNIKKLTSVTWFPFFESTALMISANGEFRNALAKLCSLKNPGVDKLDSLAANIVGIWVSSDNRNIPVQSIYDKLIKSTTSFIKRPGLSAISPELANTLNSIHNFEWWVEQGYLNWRFNKNDSGIIPYSIDSEKFRNIEQKILEQKPDQFSALEELI